MGNGIISSRTFVSDEYARGIVIRVPGERKEPFVKNILSIPEIKEARELALESWRQNIPDSLRGTPAQAAEGGELVGKLLVPNLT